MGVLVAQTYRLQHAPNPNPVFGYYTLGKPVAAIMQTSALLVLLVGSHRFWRQQSAMVRGKIHAGGWEVYVVGAYTLLLLISLFTVHVGIDIYKSLQ
ncbi:hypothetical protein AMS68_001406 [Peltaster fructicola]|uniref:DUF202 domain-containing protein n=1 Tax=Peltaster fructicola TaxID=286661 RepID=A0A6H0XMN8_9PEZI|nr:hypothetical protein AMS68_001406 [Peltaster fructicola]